MRIDGISGFNIKASSNQYSLKLSFSGYDNEDDDDGVNWVNGWGPLPPSKLTPLCESWQAKTKSRINEEKSLLDDDVESHTDIDTFVPRKTKVVMD